MRHHNFKRFSGVLAVFFGVAVITTLFAQEAAQTIIKRDPIYHDFYAAGQTVHIAGSVEGDAVIVGRRLAVDNRVKGDVIAAGETIHITGYVEDDIRAAGRLIQIAGPVGDHIVAAGETITLGPKANIRNWVWSAGRQIEVLGTVGGDFRARGDTVIIGGVIRGNTEIIAEHVRILDGAVLHGQLRIQSPHDPDIAAGARILGNLQRLPMPEVEAAPVLKVIALLGLVVTLGLILTGVVYFLLFPQFSVMASRHIEQAPLASLGLGLAVLVVTPVLIGLLFSTGFGFLLGIVLIAAYLLMLIVGGMTGVIYVSDVGLRKIFNKDTVTKGLMIFTLIVTFLVLGIVQLIPVLGCLLVFLLLIMGVGALNQQLWQRYQA